MPNPWTEYLANLGVDPMDQPAGGGTPFTPDMPGANTPAFSQPGSDQGYQDFVPEPMGGAYAQPFVSPVSQPRARTPLKDPADQPAVSGADASARAGPAGDAVTNYIREAAASRGINPDVALKIAAHEGGTDKYEGNTGQFKTGRSHWAFQLHYGGAGTPYASWGDTAGMGNDFTERTGYQPGDPQAWKAAIDFALDHARRNGWGAWYGRKPAGVGLWDGIPQTGAR